jgi:hypothetical protein
MGKGQATLEAMASFLATAAMITILSMAIIGQISKARETAYSMERISESEGMVRALETCFLSGGNQTMDFSGNRTQYRVENGRFLVPHGSQVIEAEGVFVYDATEPV